MRSLPPTPLAPPFRFGTTPPDLAHNAGLLEAAQFDLAQLLPRHQRSTLGFGSEFRPVPDLEPLLGRHPLFPFVSGILSNGMDYEFHEGKELSESERLIEMAGQLQRGNHKSVTDALETVQTLLTKDVTHGFTLPLACLVRPPNKGSNDPTLGSGETNFDEQRRRPSGKVSTHTRFVVLPRRTQSLGQRAGESQPIPGNDIRVVHAPHTPPGISATRRTPRHANLYLQVRLQ